MAQMKAVRGGCHCGGVRFEAAVDFANAMTCNCTHCDKKGFVLTFAPGTKFRLVSGQGLLTEYRFNKREIAHMFCSVCGVQPFGFGKDKAGNPIAAVNLRCVDGVNLNSLKSRKVDGKRL